MLFQNDWAKTEVCLIPTMFHRQSAKSGLNFWLCDQKSIEFVLSWWWTYVWSLNVIGQKYKSVSRPQGKVLRNHPPTHARTHPTIHGRPHWYLLSNAFSGVKWVGFIIFYFSKKKIFLLIWCFKKPLLKLPPKLNSFKCTWKAESI